MDVVLELLALRANHVVVVYSFTDHRFEAAAAGRHAAPAQRIVRWQDAIHRGPTLDGVQVDAARYLQRNMSSNDYARNLHRRVGAGRHGALCRRGLC